MAFISLSELQRLMENEEIVQPPMPDEAEAVEEEATEETASSEAE